MTLHKALMAERRRELAARVAECCRATRWPKAKPSRQQRLPTVAARKAAAACC
jgi:hypothetical protein